MNILAKLKVIILLAPHQNRLAILLQLEKFMAKTYFFEFYASKLRETHKNTVRQCAPKERQLAHVRRAFFRDHPPSTKSC